MTKQEENYLAVERENIKLRARLLVVEATAEAQRKALELKTNQQLVREEWIKREMESLSRTVNVLQNHRNLNKALAA